MTEWGALWQLWESWIVRLGTVVLMLVPICKYVLFPTVKGVRGFLQRAREVSREVAEIRAHAASMSTLVEKELTNNGGASMKDKQDRMDKRQAKMQRDIENLSGSVVAYVFRHDAQHTEEWEYLRDEYGLDRRDDDSAG